LQVYQLSQEPDKDKNTAKKLNGFSLKIWQLLFNFFQKDPLHTSHQIFLGQKFPQKKKQWLQD